MENTQKDLEKLNYKKLFFWALAYFTTIVIVAFLVTSCRNVRSSGAGDTEIYNPKLPPAENSKDIEAMLLDLDKIKIQIGDASPRPIFPIYYSKGKREEGDFTQIQWKIKNFLRGAEQKIVKLSDLPKNIKIVSTETDDPNLTRISLKITTDNIIDPKSPIRFTIYYNRDSKVRENTEEIFSSNSKDVFSFTYVSRKEGTSENPWGVYNYVDLYNVRNALNDSYLQQSDIDLPEITDKEANKVMPNYSLYGWEPIGNGQLIAQETYGHYINSERNSPYFSFQRVKKDIYGTFRDVPPFSAQILGSESGILIGTPFAGVYDGQSYAIRNLVIETPDLDTDRAKENINAGTGLFGASVGEIKNLQLLDINISTNRETGGLVGIMAGEYCFPVLEEPIYSERLWNRVDGYDNIKDCTYMRRNTVQRMIRTIMRYSKEGLDYYEGMLHKYDRQPKETSGFGEVSIVETFNRVTRAYKSITHLPPELKVAKKTPRIASVYVSGNIVKKRRTNLLKPEVYKTNLRYYSQFCRGRYPYYPACINPNFLDHDPIDWDLSDSTGAIGSSTRENYSNDGYGVQDYLSNGFKVRALTDNEKMNGVDDEVIKNYYVKYIQLGKVEQIAIGGAVGVMTFGELFEVGTNVDITQEEVELRENYLSVGGLVGFVALNHSALIPRPQDNRNYFKNLIHIKRSFSLGYLEGGQIDGGLIGTVTFNPNNFLMTMIYRFYDRDTINIEDVYSNSKVKGLKLTGGLIGFSQVPLTLKNAFFNGSTENYNDYTMDPTVTEENPESFRKVKKHAITTANDIFVFPEFIMAYATWNHPDAVILPNFSPNSQLTGCWEPGSKKLTKPENCFSGYAVASSTFKNIYYIESTASLDATSGIGGNDSKTKFALPHYYMSMNLGITGSIRAGEENMFERLSNIMDYRNSGRYPLLFEKIVENVRMINEVRTLTKNVFSGFDFSKDWILAPGGKTYPILRGSFGGADDSQPTENVQSD